MSSNRNVLGIDIGGTGCKGAVVNIETGELVTERFRIDTPQPATPKTVGSTVKSIIKHFNWTGSVGMGFPAIMKDGVAKSAANIHESWFDFDVEKHFSNLLNLPVKVTNDADAAGIAAIRFGAGKGQKGTVLFLTIGTGIGSALFLDEQLMANSEFGHLYFRKKIAEKSVSNAVRKQKELSYKKWGKAWKAYLRYLERIIAPDLIILGGGGGKKFKEIEPFIQIETKVVPAVLQNNAGIIGAAMYAGEKTETHQKKASFAPPPLYME